MAYECPRCQAPVQRAQSVNARGLAPMLIAMAFAGFECGECGAIPKSEFPPAVRSQMTRNSVLLVFGGVGILVVAIIAIIAINSI